MVLITQKFRTDQFHYHKDDNSFTQEISSLGNCNLSAGFVLISHLTEKEIHFCLKQELRDPRENELEGWEYEVAPISKQDFPHLSSMIITIFND